MTSGPRNFAFLDKVDGRMSRLASQAESYVHTDPDSCLFKLRLMIETMAKQLLELSMPRAVSSDLGAMLRSLERAGTIPRGRADTMHAIRRDGNAAVHGEATSPPTALRRLRDAHAISSWYCTMIRRGVKIKAGDFVVPHPPKGLDERTREALARAEALEDEIEARRVRTREALLLYCSGDDVEHETARLHAELEALDRVAAEAGEPLVDAESVALVMAMELESLLEHPHLGLTSRDAKREAERQLEATKCALDDREERYAEERAALAREILERQHGGDA